MRTGLFVWVPAFVSMSMHSGTVIFGYIGVRRTHTLIGCIVAIGFANGNREAVNGNVLANIAGSWFVTLPVSAFFTVLFYLAARPMLPLAPALGLL